MARSGLFKMARILSKAPLRCMNRIKTMITEKNYFGRNALGLFPSSLHKGLLGVYRGILSHSRRKFYFSTNNFSLASSHWCRAKCDCIRANSGQSVQKQIQICKPVSCKFVRKLFLLFCVKLVVLQSESRHLVFVDQFPPPRSPFCIGRLSFTA